MITLEEIKTIYFNPDAIRLPNYKVGRASGGSAGRLYYRYGYKEPQSVELFNSATTVLWATTKMEEPLLEWYCKLGLVEARRFLKLRQMFGSLMHEMIGDYCIKQVMPLDDKYYKATVEAYASKHNYWQPECEWWWRELQSAMAAWMEFVFKTKMKCIAVEMMLVSEAGFATLIDVVCDITLPQKGNWGEVYASGARKGEPKETYQDVRYRTLINMKSGKNFYRSNAVQLNLEKKLFEENFPDIKVEKILNWKPNEWENIDSDGKYTIKDWTDEISEKEMVGRLMVADEVFKKDMLQKEFIYFTGEVLYGNDPTKNMGKNTLLEKITSWEESKKKPEVENG